MIKLKEFIQRAKAFINANPQRKKLLLIIFVLAIIPLTVIAALTVQDLRQRAGGTGVQIVDVNGNFLTTTSDTQVYLRINLPDNWVSLSMNKNNLINQAYAQTSQCSPPYQGFLGCFSSFDRPSGSVCTSSCTTDDGQSGQWCYNSTTVGNSCTNSVGQSGVCNEQGTCAIPVYSTPVYLTPTPSSPQFTANCGNQNCSSNQTCIGTSYDSSTICLQKGAGGIGSYCGTPAKSPNNDACSSGYCDSTLRCANNPPTVYATPVYATPVYATPVYSTPTPSSPTSGISPTSGPTPTPILNIIQGIYIENRDSDGSIGGSNPISVTSNFSTYINSSIPWKLNELMVGQNQGTRVVEVTLFSDMRNSITLSASVNLVRPNGPPNGIQLRPNVFVIEDDGTSSTMELMKKFYEKYPDKYDFLGVYVKKSLIPVNETAVPWGGVVYYNIKGGFSTYTDIRFQVGSKRLLGFLDVPFNSSFDVPIGFLPTKNPILLIDYFYFGILIHELLHAFGEVTLPNELIDAQALLAGVLAGVYDRYHFEANVGSWISADLTTRRKNIEINGRYYQTYDCSKEPKHHDFDLYAMGLKSPEEITEKLIVARYKGQGVAINPKCNITVEIPSSYDIKAYSIQDFINVLGPRIPSIADSRKGFTIASVIVFPKGYSLSQKEIDAISWIADKLPVVWYKSTEGRSTLNGIKPKDLIPPVISNVKTSATKSSIEVTWATNEPATSFVIYTDPMGQSFIFPINFENPPRFLTSHEINIESNRPIHLLPNTAYSIKIISIDEDYNMGSFDAGKIVTTDKSSSITPSTSVTNTVIPSKIDFDLNNDGVVNCKDVKIFIDQYGQKGTNLSADLNHDGIVDGIDYNTLVRNYTPGDTTVCAQ